MKGPRFHFITLFPEVIEQWLNTSILGRARTAGLFQAQVYQLRDFSTDKHRNVDDVAYGGGGGMVLKVEPLVRALNHIQAANPNRTLHRVYFSPKGKRLDQGLVEHCATQFTEKDFVLICGHYEGVDERFLDGWVDEQISLGDFVLTGGELPALAFCDALARQVEDVLGYEEAAMEESFGSSLGKRLLEYPHYTRPANYEGREVPSVLLSGNHEAILAWRRKAAEDLTRMHRPDLLHGSIDEPNQN